MITKVQKIVIVMLWFCIMSAPLAAQGEDSPPTEYQLKAAFLLNFAKFLEWPPEAFSSPDAPIILVILGENPFGDAFDAIRGKLINGRKVLINPIKEVQDIRACHILFVSAAERDSLPSILRTLRNSKILVVGDMPNFAERGGVIGFVTQGRKIGFEINVDAAQRAGITISSKLLNLAKRVHDSSGRESN